MFKRGMCLACLMLYVALEAAASAGENLKWPGAYLFVSIPGTQLNDATRQLLEEIKPAGVVLNGNNVKNAQQTQALVKEIKKAVGLGDGVGDLPLIAVDQEGGRINRLKIKDAPSCAVLGAQNSPAQVEQVGRRYAQECRVRGVTMMLAPVLDVYAEGGNKIIGDRSFGQDPQVVARLASAFAAGAMREGVIPVGKHFPGHGATREDSHTALAVMPKDDPMVKAALAPFEQLARAQLPAIMTGHIACPAMGVPGPASLSPVMVRDLLRQKWGYDGYVITDDINMKGVGDSHAKAVVAALKAGNDAAILMDFSPQVGRAVCDAVRAAAQSGELDARQLERSRQRLRRLQDWLEVMDCMARFPALQEAAPQPPVPVLEPVRPQGELDALASAERAAPKPVASPAPANAAQTSSSTPAVVPAAAQPAAKEKQGADMTKPAAAKPKKHVVKSGETLSAIGRRYKVSVSSIKKLNHLKKDNVNPGQELLLP